MYFDNLAVISFKNDVRGKLQILRHNLEQPSDKKAIAKLQD